MMYYVSIKKIGKIIIGFFKDSCANYLRKFGIIDFHVPPYVNRLRTGGTSIRSYYESGLATYYPIFTAASFVGVKFKNGLKILDLGCGVGRQLMHFSRNHDDVNLYACDVDNTAISFIKKAYPYVNSYCSNEFPPLKFDNNFFDVVYSVSVITHLTVDRQRLWLEEISRITKKGGYCFLTTAGNTVHAIGKRQWPELWGRVTEKELVENGFVYREYGDFLAEKSNEGRFDSGGKYPGIEFTYGNMIMSESYIKSKWEEFSFDVVEVLEGVIDRRQDLVVLCKI